MKFKKNMVILPSVCDVADKLSVADSAGIFQDIATEHAQIMGVDGDTLLEKSGGFWVVLKTKIIFFRRPAMLENVTVATWPNTPRGLRCTRNYTVEQNGATIICGKSQWAILDSTTHHPRKLESTCCPMDSILP